MPVQNRKYLYDGWNVVLEFEGRDKLVMSYLWGLDLDGQNGGAPFGQGAGGVGGLLCLEKHTGPDAGAHFVVYDGNGNVTGLVDANSGEPSAEYEYDPFGNLLSAVGPFAHLNPFRFSTKYHDSVTGLYYYGFRYYDPVTGRWLSRDPLGEKGGPNLYLFAANNTQSFFDPDGLEVVAFYDYLDDGQLGKVANGKDFMRAALRSSDRAFAVNNIEGATLILKQLVLLGVQVDEVIIFGHGAKGLQQLGPFYYSLDIDGPFGRDSFKGLGEFIKEGGPLTLLGCEVAKDQKTGQLADDEPRIPLVLTQYTLQNLSTFLDRPVRASTGNVDFKGIYVHGYRIWPGRLMEFRPIRDAP